MTLVPFIDQPQYKKNLHSTYWHNKQIHQTNSSKKKLDNKILTEVTLIEQISKMKGCLD